MRVLVSKEGEAYREEMEIDDEMSVEWDGLVAVRDHRGDPCGVVLLSWCTPLDEEARLFLAAKRLET